MFLSRYHIGCQCQLFFILKYILGLSIFVSGVSDDRKNGALKVVDVSISHSLKILSHTIQI